MSAIKLSGSCLCGAVRYEISGSEGRFWHCHCKRCRKATGTGHASNVLLKPDSVDWVAGEELLKIYKVPDAKRFAAVFWRLRQPDAAGGSRHEYRRRTRRHTGQRPRPASRSAHISGFESGLVLRWQRSTRPRHLPRMNCTGCDSPVLCELVQGNLALIGGDLSETWYRSLCNADYA